MENVFLVESMGTITVFASRELAEQSVKQTRERLVGGGYIGNLQYEIHEMHVHTRPFEVRQ